MRNRAKKCSGAMAFITLMGIVSLFSDMQRIMKAAVSRMIPKSMRSTGFGIFETGFGIAWFLGSWILGVLYDTKPSLLVAVSASAQVLAILFYVLCIRQQQKETQ